MIKTAVQSLTPQEFEAKVERIPLKEQRDKWRESAAQLWTPQQLDEWRRKVRASIQRMEQGMAGPWMLGQQFTLADVSLFSMLIGMPQRFADIVNEKDSPRVVEWYARAMERPGVKATLAIPQPSREFLAARQKAQGPV
jgi:glutathione S-transferase